MIGAPGWLFENTNEQNYVADRATGLLQLEGSSKQRVELEGSSNERYEIEGG